MGITTSKSSALWIFTPLIFEMQLINGALFLNATALNFIYLFIYFCFPFLEHQQLCSLLKQYTHHCNYINQILTLMF